MEESRSERREQPRVHVRGSVILRSGDEVVNGIAVSVSATTSERSMAIEAPIGIGLIYGPIIPDTNAIGSTAAITVNVARMVGLPTSLIAKIAACNIGKRFILK